MRRLLDTQRMLVQFSRENDRLASENGRLRMGKTLVANDYAGARAAGARSKHPSGHTEWAGVAWLLTNKSVPSLPLLLFLLLQAH